MFDQFEYSDSFALIDCDEFQLIWNKTKRFYAQKDHGDRWGVASNARVALILDTVREIGQELIAVWAAMHIVSDSMHYSIA